MFLLFFFPTSKEVETNKSWLHPGKKVDHPYGPGTSYERDFAAGISIDKGEDIAHFRLGSTVVLYLPIFCIRSADFVLQVLVFAADKNSAKFVVNPGDKVCVGQNLMTASTSS